MAAAKVYPVNLSLTGDVIRLANRAITGGAYGSVSAYVRALIVKERVESGDKAALRVNLKIRRGRPRAA